MNAQLKRAFWGFALILMVVAVNINVVFAQDEAEAVSEGGELAGPMIFVLLLGITAVIAIGGAINSQQAAAEDSNS